MTSNSEVTSGCVQTSRAASLRRASRQRANLTVGWEGRTPVRSRMEWGR